MGELSFLSVKVVSKNVYSEKCSTVALRKKVVSVNWVPLNLFKMGQEPYAEA